MTYAQEELDSLTPEERAALDEPDGGSSQTLGESMKQTEEGGGADDNDDNANGEGDEHKGAGKGEEDEAAAAAAAAEAEAAAAAGAGDGAGDGAGADDAGTAAEPEAPAPLLVAEMPENADARLKEIGDKKATLVEQFDNGDITAKEYQTGLDALGKEERELERAIDKANTALEMRQQQERNAWQGQIRDFTTKAHPEYTKSKFRWQALDAAVKEIGALPENANLTGPQLLAKAHAAVVADLGESPKTKQADAKAAEKEGKPDLNVKGRPLKGSKVEAPKTLRNAPASETNNTDDGKYAALDRLRESDPEAHEERLMRMSAADRDAYLAHG